MHVLARLNSTFTLARGVVYHLHAHCEVLSFADLISCKKEVISSLLKGAIAAAVRRTSVFNGWVAWLPALAKYASNED